MGIIRMGPPTEMILELRDAYNISNFIETGTYYGNTVFWASQFFDHALTIEYSESIYNQVTGKFGHVKNIEFLYGDTRDKLKDIISKLKSPSIFWLDAHWSGDLTYGGNDDCPIIEEIGIINSFKYANFIFIDDARFFMSPPPHPHAIEKWPDITVVLNALQSTGEKKYIVIIEDVIIAVPDIAKTIVSKYCQYVNTKLWENHDKTGFKKGLALICQDLKKCFGLPKKIVNNLFNSNVR